MNFLRTVGIYFLTFLFILFVFQYLLCPQYSFTSKKPFTGVHWYNPYQQFHHATWSKGNFHAHCKSWEGITNGHGTVQQLIAAYKQLGYQYISASNYHKIDSSLSTLPAYEHGFNLLKTHQLVLGASSVFWSDFIFPQSLSNKQWILNQMSYPKNTAIVLNHPELRNGYTKEDMSFLCNYDLMEVIHPSVNSSDLWDAALSHGNPIFLIGNDDLHNVFNHHELGRICTLLPSGYQNKDSIVDLLKTGQSMVYKIEETARKSTLPLPQLISCTIDSNQLLSIEMNQKATQIRFIAQEGQVVKTLENSASVRYQLTDELCYLRTEFEYPDGSILYLNPFYKYENFPFERKVEPKIHPLKSQLFFLGGVLLLFLWFFLLFKNKLNSFLYKIAAMKTAPYNRKSLELN